MDSKSELAFAADLVDAIELIAKNLALLGNGGAYSGPPGAEVGAIEGLSMTLEKGLTEMTDGLNGIAAALQQIADQGREKGLIEWMRETDS